MITLLPDGDIVVPNGNFGRTSYLILPEGTLTGDSTLTLKNHEMVNRAIWVIRYDVSDYLYNIVDSAGQPPIGLAGGLLPRNQQWSVLLLCLLKEIYTISAGQFP